MTENQKPSVQFIEISDDNEGQRIDNYLKTKLKGVPKSALYRVIRKGEVRVNKKRIKPEYKLQVGDLVRIPPIKVEEKPEPTISTSLNQVSQLESAILYEDDAFIVLNKPTGLAVHGGSGLNFGVIEALRALRPQARQLELVHRLDRDTSGCLLIAKKRSALRIFHEQLRDKTIRKHYWALVKGVWDSEIRAVNKPLYKNVLSSGERVVKVDHERGKPSETRFRVLSVFDGCSLVQASPITGRTHQIRVHTACNGHPIAADPKYGDTQFDQTMREQGLKRLFLHAFSLSFEHPITGESMYIEAPLDKSLKATLARLGFAC